MNNQNIKGYDPQTGQPIYENLNQINNNLNNRQYNNENPVISEQLKKSRKTLHKDSIILMIVSIVAMITGILFLTIGINSSINLYEESSIDLFMESLFYLIFLIIIICNKKEIKKFVGVLAIIVSCFMILFAIFNHSLFDIIYFILGIFYMIHAIKHLKNIKRYIPVKEIQTKLRIDKLKYVSLVLVIMCFVYPFVSIFLGFFIDNMFFIDSPFLVVFVCALTSLILNIILVVKKRKSTILYVCMVFSIIISLITGLFIPNYFKGILRDTKWENSEENIISKLQDIEYHISQHIFEMKADNFITMPVANSNYTVLIDKSHYEEAIKLRNDEYKDSKKWISSYEENKVDGYVCDGYTELRRFYSSDECINYNSNNTDCDRYDKEIYKGDVHIKTYISCTGKYDYQTAGFDESKLKQSKDENQYRKLEMLELEAMFKNDIMSLYKYRINNATNSMVITKSEFEKEIGDMNSFESSFELPQFKNYTCDGYVILSLDSALNEIVGQPYISCTGKYNYQTEGYDNTKLTS